VCHNDGALAPITTCTPQARSAELHRGSEIFPWFLGQLVAPLHDQNAHGLGEHGSVLPRDESGSLPCGLRVTLLNGLSAAAAEPQPAYPGMSIEKIKMAAAHAPPI
jgi:hypothetical protein